MIHSTSVDVRRASHTQKAPHTVFAQSIPMTSVTVVNTTPTSAPERAKRSAAGLSLRR